MERLDPQPRQRLAPGVLPASRGRPARVTALVSLVWPAFFCVVHRLIGQRESDCRSQIECIRPIRGVGDAQRVAQKHFAQDWWIMTLTTEIQANFDNMVA